MSNLGNAVKNRMTVICVVCFMAYGEHRMENCPDGNRWGAIRRYLFVYHRRRRVRRRFLVSSDEFVLLRCLAAYS